MRMGWVLLLMAGACAAGAAEESAAGIAATGAVVEKLAEGFEFTEGPASDAAGNVYFTDQPNDRIMKWSVDDKLTTYMQPCGRSNGLCFDREGHLWACADEKNQLWRINPGKEVSVLVEAYEEKLLNGPNDVWVRPDGGAYFTDPFYKRNYWERSETMEQPCQGVYYLAPDRKTLTLVLDDLEQPNGIIGTPDGKKLYVTDIKAGKTYAYTMAAEGRLTEKVLFCEMGSDGMTLDDEGNVYLTGKGVFVFDKSGKRIDHIVIDEPWTSNVCFSGRAMNDLFITASKAIYRLRTRVKGVGSQ